MERNTVDGIELEWIKHSPLTVVLYILVALLTVLYYATCFVFQYGNYLPKATRNSVFGELFNSISNKGACEKLKMVFDIIMTKNGDDDKFVKGNSHIFCAF